MSRSLNMVQLIGNLGADPDVRYTTAGAAITNIRVATTESWKDKQTGEKQERTEWSSVVFFGKLAEIAGEYLKKGQTVYLKGKLRTEEYEKDGVKKFSTKVYADEMLMLGGNRDGGDSERQSAPTRSKPPQTPARSAVPVGGHPLDEDDIPFAPRGKRSYFE